MCGKCSEHYLAQSRRLMSVSSYSCCGGVLHCSDTLIHKGASRTANPGQALCWRDRHQVGR